MKKSLSILMTLALLSACGHQSASQQETSASQTAQESVAEPHPEQTLLLKDFRPVNVNNIPETHVEKAKYAVLDMHSHDYAATPEEIDAWVETMDQVGVEQTHIMHCSWIGDDFETVVSKYAAHQDRFRFWCCLDYSHYGQPDFAEHCIAQLERCHELGATGVGELGDKGEGDLYARPVEGKGIHLNDPALRPVLARCGELHMPISIHIAEPYWMYLPMDETNDGLINGALWHVDTTVPGCLDYDGLMDSFEQAVRENPQTIFIACHYLNMNQDYPRLAALLDKYPNLYIDIAARVGEAAQIPRASRAFIIKYQDRILFGTDNGMSANMYRTIYRVLETEDEHFYVPDFNYHWYYSGFYLPDSVLKKIYRTNAERLLTQYK